VSNFGTDGRLGLIRLRTFKSRFGFSGTLIYHYTEGRFIQNNDANSLSRTVTEQLTELLRANPSVTAKNFEVLAAEGGLGRNRARVYLNDGVLARRVRRENGTRNAKHHFLATEAKSDAE
jgi:hypothetical protein